MSPEMPINVNLKEVPLTTEKPGLCPGGPPVPWEWKREEDSDFSKKVKEVRDGTGRPVNHCVWMLEMCYGNTHEAIRIFGLFRKWSYA